MVVIDIRSENEIKKLRLNDSDVICIPTNLLSVCRKKILSSFPDIKLLCMSGRRAQEAKNTYFKDEEKVSVVFGGIKKLQKDGHNVIVSEGADDITTTENETYDSCAGIEKSLMVVSGLLEISMGGYFVAGLIICILVGYLQYRDREHETNFYFYLPLLLIGIYMLLTSYKYLFGSM